MTTQLLLFSVQCRSFCVCVVVPPRNFLAALLLGRPHSRSLNVVHLVHLQHEHNANITPRLVDDASSPRHYSDDSSICLGLSPRLRLLFQLVACYYMTDHDRRAHLILRTFPHRDSVRDCQETVIVFQVWPLADRSKVQTGFQAWWMVPLALCQVALAMSCAFVFSLPLIMMMPLRLFSNVAVAPLLFYRFPSGFRIEIPLLGVSIHDDKPF